jgi:hypothetical protein
MDVRWKLLIESITYIEVDNDNRLYLLFTE